MEALAAQRRVWEFLEMLLARPKQVREASSHRGKALARLTAPAGQSPGSSADHHDGPRRRSVVHSEAFQDPRCGTLDAYNAGLGLLGAVEVE